MSNAIATDIEGLDRLKSSDSPYRRYNCQQGNPLGCTIPQSIAETGQPARACSVCGFPARLAEKTEIQGQIGTYRIDAWIGKRGLGRLYRATLLGLNQAVVIKEYLLPPLHFSTDEIRQRQLAFTQVIGIRLADGREQDFRLLTILEAIADPLHARCYLVLECNSATPTLRQYLLQGAFSDNRVYRVLQQVLQSLKFLHGQNFRLPSGQMAAGLVHGNLGLDSLLLHLNQADPEVSLSVREPKLKQDEFDDFFIYLCDLNLWESLFLPPLVQTNPGSTSEDLTALGSVAFELLSANIAQEVGVQLDPRNSQHWPPVGPALKQFILRLLRLEEPFESADDALQALQRSPLPARPVPPPTLNTAVATARPRRIEPWVILVFSILLLALLGWLTSLLFSKWSTKPSIPKSPLLCCLKEVAGIPPGTFTYSAVQNGIWSYVLQQKNLIRQGVNLEQQLKMTHPQLNLKFEPTPSTEQAIANVRSGNAEFAIAPLIHPLSQDLESQVIAYDGVAVFVAFSYSKREQSLPVQLNGQMTLSQLRQVYATHLENWQAFNGPPLRMQRYSPQNYEALEVFRTRIFNQGAMPKPLPEFEMMRTIIRDFELRIAGSIGFASFSKVVGQCSVYPLALKIEGQDPVQALQLNSGKAISPTTDLCSKKGTYGLNPQVFRTGLYPLAYPIAVIYPRDNDRSRIGENIAKMLKTQEGQRLLTETGLVALSDTASN
jgi:serine/threonine protein kinase